MAPRPIRLAAVLAAGALIATGPALGVAVAADPPAATSSVAVDTADRSLHLASVQNARDVGGYRTIDGRMVRTGVVFRSADLSKLSDADSAALTASGLRTVADLRTGYERALSPDRIPAGAQLRIHDVIGQAPPQVMASTLSAGSDLYRAFITAPGANEAFAGVLHDILDADGSVLFHCSAGKDRTGWTAAVLLTILGVDRGTVNYDFLLSNYYRDASEGDALNGVVLSALDSAFDQVDQTYGSFDNYVHDGLKLTDADVAALKAKLLVS
ncbi:putative tyrosine-protein phosphatase [Nocardia nova SH22a]|uniref:Putative tyrosine-protein phosphatase n=1 Tax=Nocardia nova SH22a TaxID=1415166 RepID=W5TS37_9NOCA|nr:tyrosine-protein phosphatase [Nocardia nova]AHH20031.1 putative tyrosine-protein phosphatase [Nocardia nova SH22a]